MAASGNPYARKLCALAFLAPELQDVILQGRQPRSLTLGRLLSLDLPLAWEDQIRLLGPIAKPLAP